MKKALDQMAHSQASGPDRFIVVFIRNFGVMLVRMLLLLFLEFLMRVNRLLFLMILI